MTPIEAQLRNAANHPQMFAAAPPDANRITENLLAVHAELDAPQEPRLARVLRRLGVGDLTVPLVTATPALRRSWFIAVAVAVLFALSVASNNEATGVDRIGVFLTLAPLVPLLGVALAFGRGVDPTHDIVVAAPRDTFTVFLIRALTVLAASAAVLLLGSMLLPAGGLYRVAWLLPSAAIASLALAVAARFDARRVASLLAIGWIVLVVLAISFSSVAAAFGPPMQIAAVVVAAAAVAWSFQRRNDYGLGQVER